MLTKGVGDFVAGRCQTRLFNLNYTSVVTFTQYLEIKIYHLGKISKYEVIELFREAEGMSFRIYCNKVYLFTIIPELAASVSFKLTNYNMAANTIIDRELYLKVEAALCSTLLTAPHS